MDHHFSFCQGDSAVLQFTGKWGARIYDERELIQMYIHLLLAALFPIIIGSHASLRRPPSAPAPKKTKMEDEDGDEIEPEPIVEGLSPSDAIMFPVLAGITLAILYFIIKWLEDPAILNRIMGWYFSGLGVFGIGKLGGDGLNMATTFLFPSVWSSGKDIYHVVPLLSQQVTGEVHKARSQTTPKFSDKNNPFPGKILSNIKFSETTTNSLWSFRALLNNHWIFRGYLHGVFNLKSRIRFNDAVGFLFGIAAIVLYNTYGKAWWLTNLIGFGFCYGTLQLMSPTTFWTGSLVLLGLFIYDITMVFYTPMMVTVATKLDVPIKLVFPGPKRGGMLGLGDVVLPGIMMALALRFDLYVHYLNKKNAYLDPTGVWGERFWTRPVKNGEEPTAADGARFPKPYFIASVLGYVFGMLVTLWVLNVYNHAQPALLYLVPGVLIALWGTAYVRGEFWLMWNYTEDGSLEKQFETKNEGDEAKRAFGKSDGSLPRELKVVGRRSYAAQDSPLQDAMLRNRGVDVSDAERLGKGDDLIRAKIEADNAEEKARKMAEAGKGLRTMFLKKDNASGDGSDDIVSTDLRHSNSRDDADKEPKEDEHAHHVFMFSLSEPKSAFPKKAKLFENA